MRLLILFLLVLLNSCVNQFDPNQFIIKEKLEKDILVLASDSLLGRAPLSIGEVKTLDYLQKRMKGIGLEPAFEGSFMQEVPLVAITSKLPNKIVVSNKTSKIELNPSEHFTMWSPMLAEKVNLNSSELVFAGFGINAPERNWNDFEGLDIAGKTVVVLVNDPGFYSADSTLFNGKAMTYYGRWSYKFEEANRQGAAGCIIVHEDIPAGYPWGVVDGRTNRFEYYLNDENIRNRTCKVNGWITLDAAKELFKFCGLDYEEMRTMATNPGFKPVSMNAKYSISIENSWKESSTYNVGGVIRGSELPSEALVYSAHWDHLGVGRAINGDSIYNGASDNAAAMAWMLSIAETFKGMDVAPKRSILFLSPSVEEAAMLGSQYYVNNPVFDHSKTVACINNDVIMFIGKYKDVTVTGLGHSELDKLLEEEAAKQGRYICGDPNPENGMFFRSDQMPFLRAGVPSIFAKGYSHQVDMGREKTLKAVDDYWKNTYHKPSDQYIPGVHNLDGLVEDTHLFFQLGLRLANGDSYPKWNRVSEFYTER